MPKVTFKINLEKDMRNIWNKVNNPPQFGNFNINPELIKICKNKSFQESKPKLKSFLNKLYKSDYLETFRNTIQDLWDKIEPEFFNRMDTLMKNSYKKDITGYITTLDICPYDPNEPSFMVSLYTSLQGAMVTTAHEIMHLYFHEFYWEEVEKKIGEKTHDLKEALTVLLNLDFLDLWFRKDRGYEIHNKLREFIVKSWKKNKDLDNLLEECILYLKQPQK